ncbi:hypothetical protein [Parabacteroides goldsteinii]|jgi:hypothetical protein|uniref:Uncharacterized protein n=1 Tax=Parabacteroides goldsteinii TaxID=328812 RepID=A0A0J6FJ79_9BACT|nr:hypothetical protein [Parabacteroides goldsteinii]KMM34492.1 hypothetical protein ACM15_06245 [Parabacteroides goldsteinii]
MERKIGEIFRAGGHSYQCVANNPEQPCCKYCAMLTGDHCVSSLLNAGECISDHRSDNRSVRFVECNIAEA